MNVKCVDENGVTIYVVGVSDNTSGVALITYISSNNDLCIKEVDFAELNYIIGTDVSEVEGVAI